MAAEHTEERSLSAALPAAFAGSCTAVPGWGLGFALAFGLLAPELAAGVVARDEVSDVFSDLAIVLATVSRRTPVEATSWLRERLHGVPGALWTCAQDGPNPYAGLLGWAQAIACTADSSNLLSEACATRVPVAAWFADQARSRAAGLIAGLQARGRLAGALSFAPDEGIVPLRETTRIAAEVRERLQVPEPSI